MKFGKTIKSLREKLGYTTFKLSQEASIAHSYIIKLERNESDNPSLRVLKKLAKVLKVKKASKLLELANE